MVYACNSPSKEVTVVSEKVPSLSKGPNSSSPTVSYSLIKKDKPAIDCGDWPKSRVENKTTEAIANDFFMKCELF